MPRQSVVKDITTVRMTTPIVTPRCRHVGEGSWEGKNAFSMTCGIKHYHLWCYHDTWYGIITFYIKRDRMNEKIPEDKKFCLFSIARLKFSVINISLELACYILTPLPSFLSK